MVIILTPYSKFCTDTAGFEYPVRFGYDWFCCAINKIYEAKQNGVFDLRDMDHILDDIESSKLINTLQKNKLAWDLGCFRVRD